MFRKADSSKNKSMELKCVRREAWGKGRGYEGVTLLDTGPLGLVIKNITGT